MPESVSRMKLQQRLLGRSDLKVPCLGFGGGPIGNANIATDDALEAVSAAFDSGLRYFDTAPLYGLGRSEIRLGRALGSRRRESYVLATKVGRLLIHADPPTGADEAAIRYDYSYDGAMRSFATSLARAELDRIDIVLIHDIDRWTHGEGQAEMFRAAVGGAFRALAELREQGAVRAIGVGLNDSDIAERAIREMDLDVVLLAGRYTLLEQGALKGFLPECVRRSVSVVIGGPYNSGILATGPIAGALYNYAPAPPAVVERARQIEAVCRYHCVPLAAAALQFPLHHPAVATIVPGLSSVAEVERTLQLFRKKVPSAFWRDLKTERLLAVDAPVGTD